MTEIYAWVNADSRHVQLFSVTLNRTAHALCLKEIFAWVNADSKSWDRGGEWL